MKKQIVIWSGGADSSLVLWKKLLECNRTSNDSVCAISFIPDFIHEKKRKSEEIARERFKKKAKQHKYHFEHHTIKLESTIELTGRLPQQITWTCLSTLYAPKEAIVSFGYHQGDDFWRISSYAQQVRININGAMGKNIDFEFPLSCTRKYEIIDEINKYGLSKCFWTCEENVNIRKPCGKCRPCITLKLAEYEKSLIPKGKDVKK